jgi:DNA-binding NtrC family response regulator
MNSQKPLVLAIDDEVDMLATYQSIFKKNYSILTASSADQALKLIKAEPLSLILLDIRMPKVDGLQLLKQVKEIDRTLEVIMVTASKDIASAVEAMKLGAFDFVTKPFDVKELLAIIAKALEKRALVRENLYLKETLKETNSYCDLIGQSPAMKKVFKMIEQVAPTDSTVLVRGESGTGKELVARAIHTKSKRVAQPFVAVNCAAIPENLLESELFGHERGSFTGALERKLGKFELADGGTLFLDEIGCMAPAMQAKLLRVLEDRKVERLGGEKGVPVDVRIISATNIDFDQEIKNSKFRSDLYYRLNVIPVDLPPLRERKEDIQLFINYFLDKFNKLLNKQVKGITGEAFQTLLAYSWPGNVRELQNLIERLVVLSATDLISLEELPLPTVKTARITVQSDRSATDYKEAMNSYERALLEKVMAEQQGNISQAAKKLNMVRTSLIARLKATGLNS